MKLPIRKTRSYLLTLLYKASFAPGMRSVLPKTKLEIYLNLTWIFERLAYNASYAHYATWEHPGRKNTWHFLAEHIEPEFTVLDMGCSRGHYASQIATKAKKVVGVDHSAEAIAIAKRDYPRANLEFHNMDAFEYLNQNAQKFDLLVLTHVLEHLVDPREFLNKFKHFFRYIYIEVPDFDSSQLNQFRKDLGIPLVYTDEDHKWEFSRDELMNVITECGLKLLEEKRGWGVQTVFLDCQGAANG